MKKKLLSLALVLAMALTLLPTAALAAEATHTVTFSNATIGAKQNAPTTLTVSGTVAAAAVSAPETAIDPSTVATLSVALLDGKGAAIEGKTETATISGDTANGFTFTCDFANLSAGTYKATVTAAAKGEGVVLADPAPSATTEATTIAAQKTTISSVTVTATPSSITSGGQSDTTVTLAITKINNSTSGADTAVSIKSVSWAKNEGTAAAAALPTGITEGDATNKFTFAKDIPAGTYTATVELQLNDTENYALAEPVTGNTATVVVSSSGSGDTEKTISALQVGISPAPATAGEAIKFVFTPTVGDSTTSADATAAADKLTVTDVLWKLNGTTDTHAEAGKAPATAGTYTVTFAVGLLENSGYKLGTGVGGKKEISDFTVQAAPVTPTNPTTPTTPAEDNKAPSTNSQGVPVASEVNTVNQANQAISTLQNTNSDTLSERLMTNEAAASSFASLENTVKAVKGITVSVEPSSAAPSAVRSGVSVTGAAFNAVGSNVSLVVDAPSKAYSFSSGYQISMTMTGVNNTARLNVPVVITLPLPSDVNASRVVVLHYHNGSSNPSVITPVVSGSYLRFPVTGFSDFVITDREDNGYVSGGFVARSSGSGNQNDLSDVLPAIAALLSGDGVFVDVPGTHWASKEIRWARDGGLMSGYENGQFRPWASTTRQQLWMVLARLSGTRPSDMAMARQWAINTGVSDGSNPTGELSRQQLVTMLYRFAKTQGVNVSATSKLGGYTDNGKVASYAKEALSWANAKGIMGGDSKGKLNPEGTATRAHFAVFLYRYSKL